jgi:hypothetical protein
VTKSGFGRCIISLIVLKLQSNEVESWQELMRIFINSHALIHQLSSTLRWFKFWWEFTLRVCMVPYPARYHQLLRNSNSRLPRPMRVQKTLMQLTLACQLSSTIILFWWGLINHKTNYALPNKLAGIRSTYTENRFWFLLNHNARFPQDKLRSHTRDSLCVDELRI